MSDEGLSEEELEWVHAMESKWYGPGGVAAWEADVRTMIKLGFRAVAEIRRTRLSNEAMLSVLERAVSAPGNANAIYLDKDPTLVRDMVKLLASGRAK